MEKADIEIGFHCLPSMGKLAAYIAYFFSLLYIVFMFFLQVFFIFSLLLNLLG